MKNYFSKGFTLIELLIVVAIIAILAAIAVPNFLEAQVRAKVARCMADQRSINTAIETYRVDTNKLVPHGLYNRDAAGVPHLMYQRNVLDPILITTPIAYLNSQQSLLDPFQSKLYRGDVTKQQYDLYVLGRYGYSTDVLTADLNVKNTYETQWGGWRLIGAGPDQAVYNALIPPEGTIGSREGTPKLIPYDASNGTVSAGDIIRTGKGILTNSYPPGY